MRAIAGERAGRARLREALQVQRVLAAVEQSDRAQGRSTTGWQQDDDMTKQALVVRGGWDGHHARRGDGTVPPLPQ